MEGMAFILRVLEATASWSSRPISTAVGASCCSSSGHASHSAPVGLLAWRGESRSPAGKRSSRPCGSPTQKRTRVSWCGCV